MSTFEKLALVPLENIPKRNVFNSPPPPPPPPRIRKQKARKIHKPKNKWIKISK